MTVKRIFPDSHIILISTISRVKTGMRIILHPLHSVNRYIGRKQAIQFLRYLNTIQLPVIIKMRDHETCMHTGISTSRSHYLYFLTEKSRKSTH